MNRPASGNALSCCSDLFSIAITLKNSSDYGDPDGLLLKLKENFLSFESKARALTTLSEEAVTNIRYALAALLDEIILTSAWEGKGFWQSHSLQLEFFNENIAGTEFFNKADALRKSGSEQIDTLEIFYFCIVLGFEGKFKIEGLEKLRLFRNTLSEEIKRVRKGDPDHLSGKWEPPGEYLKTIKRETPIWFFSVLFFSFSMLFYLALTILVIRDSSNLLHILEGLLSEVLR
ncbi:MAG: type IVB secretion system protein IcmH/DotU [Nitrospinota bacterium]